MYMNVVWNMYVKMNPSVDCSELREDSILKTFALPPSFSAVPPSLSPGFLCLNTFEVLPRFPPANTILLLLLLPLLHSMTQYIFWGASVSVPTETLSGYSHWPDFHEVHFPLVCISKFIRLFFVLMLISSAPPPPPPPPPFLPDHCFCLTPCTLTFLLEFWRIWIWSCWWK